jgi:hypothetical protein
MTRHLRFTIAAASILILLAPALWNGFALLQYDTGGYLARWYEGHLEESRSTVYGLFLALLARPDFWPALIMQAGLTVWVLRLTLRALGLGDIALLAVTAMLSLVTALPWLASMLLTDIFAGLAVLALYLVALRPDTLARWERWALILFAAFAAATHTATLAVLLALLGAGLVIAMFNRKLVPAAALGRGALALVLSVMLLLTANLAVAGRLAWTPGGSAIVFGRMLETGIVARYLKEHCPDPRLPELCAHRDKIPNDADLFFWGFDLFDELGRFEGLGGEMATVVRDSLTAYPWLQLKAAVIGTAEQLVLVATGYGVHTELWHTYWTVARFAAEALPAMKAARQQRDALDFMLVNRIHVPVAWLSMLLLVGVVVLALSRRRFTDLGPFAAVVLLAVLANAFVCGALSNPHDRYGARIAWLAPLVVLLAAARRRP